jgi:hypothetical protein
LDWLPAEALALFARWWQLETWLRQLTYVELRALRGIAWGDGARAAMARQSQDAQYTHMSAADADNPLAYLDFSQLCTLIDAHWDLFEKTLLHRSVWVGRQEELARIRHRIGHMRHPATDDLQRLEQTLRDLERGAFIALASYNDTEVPQVGTDAVSQGWLKKKHAVAKRLTNHAERQYDTRLILTTSRRPWASQPSEVRGAPGVFWHANFVMRGRPIDARELWYDSYIRHFRDLLVHLVATSPWQIGFTFAAVDDDQEIADAIGDAFDAVLMLSRPVEVSARALALWEKRAATTDHRVIHGTGWNHVDETTLPITIFGAGGGVEQAN